MMADPGGSVHEKVFGPDGSLLVSDMHAAYSAHGWWGDVPLSEYVANNALSQPDGVAYYWDDTSISWADYSGLADEIAAQLNQFGVDRLAPVLVLLPDGAGVHATFVGCERAGLMVVGVGWRSGERELAAVIQKAAPVAAVMAETTRLGPAGELCERLGIEHLLILNDLDSTPTARKVVPQSTSPAHHDPVHPSEISMLNSTSGTTGLPKCVQQTQNRWFYFHQLAMECGRLADEQVWMSVVPAPFGFGLWTSHYSPSLIGAPCVVQSRFDARRAAEEIVDKGVTVLCAVSSQFAMILDASEDLDLSSLRVLFTGGERLPIAKARQFEERTGCAVLNFYGSNETGALSGTRVTDPLEQRIRTGGRCFAQMEVRLYDLEGNRIPGDVGEGRAACRGATTSPGYYADPDANAELFTSDGWMFMGDIVTIDDHGWLTVVGRTADFIVRGGKNISAAAVEEEVTSSPAVMMAAAIAVPDDRLGERVGICVQLAPGYELDLEDLKQHLEGRGVSREWWPEHFAVIEEFPISPGGKIAKAKLNDMVDELFPER